MAYTTENAGNGVHRILDGDVIVGLAIRATSGKWLLCDTDGKRYLKFPYTTTKAAAKGLEEIHDAGHSEGKDPANA